MSACSIFHDHGNHLISGCGIIDPLLRRWKKSSNSEFAARVDKLSNRIAKMKEDSDTWKGRTGQQNDAAQFTVQAKLAKRGLAFFVQSAVHIRQYAVGNRCCFLSGSVAVKTVGQRRCLIESCPVQYFL